MKVARIDLNNGFTLSVSDAQLPLTIGRGRQCDIRVSEATVSRAHCELSLKNGQVLCLKDISSNGTRVNHRILHGDSVMIKERSEVEFSEGFYITVTPIDDTGTTLVP